MITRNRKEDEAGERLREDPLEKGPPRIELRQKESRWVKISVSFPFLFWIRREGQENRETLAVFIGVEETEKPQDDDLLNFLQAVKIVRLPFFLLLQFRYIVLRFCRFLGFFPFTKIQTAQLNYRVNVSVN